MEAWLVTVAQLPIEDPSARMRVLRTLESLGAALLREGAYVLPDTPANRQALDALADYIGKGLGSAHVLRVTPSSVSQHEGFKRLFDRSTRYDNLVKDVEALRVGFGHSDPGAIARVLIKQRRDFEAISALDFFPSEAKARAQRAIADADAAIKRLFFSQNATSVGPGENLQGRTWATRKPLWADRMASAWLIRRFVDPEAKMLWLDKGQEIPAGAVTFAFDGAHFNNSETRVTYEEIVVQLKLVNPALGRIGSIIHYLEARGATVPEAAGVQTLLHGALRRAQHPDELFAEAEKTFGLLYEAYFESPKR